ncbi:MAG: hypothetical protein CR967_04355 [Proteobacteria bacterium]|nr:MAG: hypothetical protein CR967_04355 [Pseudomonadota bacterium]
MKQGAVKSYRWRVLSLFLVVGVVSVFTSCGGGGSSDDVGESVSKVPLTPESVDNVARSVEKLVPWCGYTNKDGVRVARDANLMRGYVLVADSVKNIGKEIKFRERTIDRTLNGTCGGTVRIKGSHDNGDDDLVYTYNNFCKVSKDGVKSYLNGTASVFKDGTPGPFGPILNSVSFSTKEMRSRMVKPSGEEKTYTVSIAKGLDTVKAGGRNNLKIEKAALVDGGKTYKASNIDIDRIGKSSIKINDATYVDPVEGAISVKTDGFMSLDSTTSTNITITRGGKSTVFKSSSTNPTIFISEEGGGFDCGRFL